MADVIELLSSDDESSEQPPAVAARGGGTETAAARQQRGRETSKRALSASYDLSSADCDGPARHAGRDGGGQERHALTIEAEAKLSRLIAEVTTHHTHARARARTHAHIRTQHTHAHTHASTAGTHVAQPMLALTCACRPTISM